MSEIASYVIHGAAQVTPATLDKVLRNLPLWKVEFAQINAGVAADVNFHPLVDQLEFLADVVEDVAEGAYKDLPYAALAAGVFALMYAHKKTDIIPDSVGPMGHSDDSSVARAVLILHEKAFAAYAEKTGVEFDRITSKP